MSFVHVQLVMDQSQTRGPCRAIMLALAYRASKDDRPEKGVRTGECFPSLDTIAEDSGLARSTVAKNISRLVRLGEITVERRGHKQRDGRSNLYRITLPASGSDGPPDGLTRKTDSPPDGLTGKVDSPASGPQLVRAPDGTSSGTRTSDSPPHGPKPKEKGKDEPSMNRKSCAPGLSDQRVDYEKAKPPIIRDYGDIHNCPDPILAAIGVTGERDKQGWGYWVKLLNQGREYYGRETADRLFRGCLDELYGEMKAGEVRNPGALLNRKLKTVLRRVKAESAVL